MRRIVNLLSVSALVLAACGGGYGSGGSPTGPAAQTTVSTQATQQSSSLQVGSSGFLTDGQGRTLYLLTQDRQASPTCSGSCADTWPPFTGRVTAGEGVDADLIGSVTRSDGGSQVTYNGWPLYYYSGDFVPGDANGQGVGGVWFVVSPGGEPVTGDRPSRADYGY